MNTDKKHDILTPEDVVLMVDTFYSAIREDDLLGPIFNNNIQDRWPELLKKMYGFWRSILFNEPLYNGSAFEAHRQLPIEMKHFKHWLKLFEVTVDSLFEGRNADTAKTRAGKIAEVFYYKIESERGNDPQNFSLTAG